MSNNKSKAIKYVDKINYIKEWSLLGPFDNVMNSGYDKDFGVLDHPEKEATFSSKYGAEISWFEPAKFPHEAYIFNEPFFTASNSISYAQSFLQVDKDQEVIANFGYSGSLKVWINDQLLYRNPEKRSTEMDYFRYKCKLKKGNNRILIQLGDFEEDNANFTIRFTDLNYNPLRFPTELSVASYNKDAINATAIPFFAIEDLEKKPKNDLISQLLLARAYRRSLELDKAEAILKRLYKDHEKNYFVLRSMILLYSVKGDNTNQNRYYEIFKQHYPENKIILENEIDEFLEEDKTTKAKELVKIYNEKYPDPFTKMQYEIAIAEKEKDNNKVLDLINKIYEENPENYDALTAKYIVEKKYYNNPEKANKLLLNYSEENYNYNVITELTKNYQEEGKSEKAFKLLEKVIDLFPTNFDTYRYKINLLSRQSKYKEALEVCEKIIANKPSDYYTLNDMAMLHQYMGNKKEAIYYNEESLRYFPFSFEVNEQIRELKGQQKAIDLIPEIDPIAIIDSYNENFESTVKRSYDIVMENKALILFKSKAKGTHHSYILKMNEESAIENWQRVSFGNSGYYNRVIEEAKTIKKTGEKIAAERNNNEVVFTNLEVGDFIFVSYSETQISGGKSSVYISDNFALNAYIPVYKKDYRIFVENGLKVENMILNSDLKPAITDIENFKQYHYSLSNPSIIKEESWTLPFNDLSQRIHVSLDYTWKDIVQWYSDLSTHQATPDFTIKNIVKELFDGKSYTEEEKAKIIYDFVCKNIQYSSIDFRQSGYIPQKASKIYNSRLGDCKDVSTLYASIARESGLKANLVLINTSNNGQKAVILPSLNFNHCIVKVYLDSGNKYLELTNPDLPFGHLYNYHKGAAILEIPTDNIPDDIKLTQLDYNKGFPSTVYRTADIDILEDNKMKVSRKSIKTGTKASAMCSDYYYADEKERKDNFKTAESKFYKSSLTFDKLDFQLLEPRIDSAIYTYSYLVDNDILKLGSLKSLKVPFTDILCEIKIFEDGERVHDFDYVSYEDVDNYTESFLINLPGSYTFTEVPEDINLSFNGNSYDLKFELKKPNQLYVQRIYNAYRENIAAKDFAKFKTFMLKVIDAENTHLLFK